MKWKLEKPYSATVEGWDDWRDENKEKYPYRFFLQETFPDWLQLTWNKAIGWKLYNAKWWILYRFHPKHRYHIIKPKSLKPNYYDYDTLILHTTMHFLTEFMDSQAKHVDWDGSSEEHSKVYAIMQEVYIWWNELYPNHEEKDIYGNTLLEYPDIPDEWGMLGIINDRYRDTPEKKAFDKAAEIHRKSEEQWVEQTEEMLIKVIKIRRFLWY